MALQDIYNLAFGTPELKSRFIGAGLQMAYTIINEDAGTANHAARLEWARAMVLDGQNGPVSENLYRLCLHNASVQMNGAASTDNDISWVVNFVISDADMLAAMGYGG